MDGARPVLDGYVGVKFHDCRLGCALPAAVAALFPRFLAAGDRLRAHGMTPLNGGNLSVRVPGGFAVTASGSHLGALEPDDVVLVPRCDVAAEEVCWVGARAPSSESLLHHLVLETHPEAGAVVHAHDPIATRAALAASGLPETEREEPYGTLALARRALETFARGGRLIVLRDHGYVAVAATLEEAVDDIVATHLRIAGVAG